MDVLDCLLLLMMWYMMIEDWPMIIGGKPNFSLLQNLLAFIPITFEMTVFFAAHLMVLTYLIDVSYIQVLIRKVLILEPLMIFFNGN